MNEATKRNTDPLLAMVNKIADAMNDTNEKADAKIRIARSRIADLEAQLVTAQATIRQQVVEVDRLNADINRLCDMMTKVHEAIHGEESK